MATVNILTSSFNGKLGEVYGTKQYGNHYAKAVPFSHAPHSPTQTKAVRAFEKLNRLASGISSIAFPYLNLSDKKMLKHNAVAQWLKPLIAKKSFVPSALAEVIQVDDTTEIVNLDVNYETNTLTVQARTFEPVQPKDGKRWFVVVFDSFGSTFIAEAPKTDFLIKSVTTSLFENRLYYAMAFRADKKGNKFFLHGLSLTVPLYIENGILYTSRTPNPNDWKVENGILRYLGTEYKIKNQVLVLE